MVKPNPSTFAGLACIGFLGAAVLTDLPWLYALSAGVGTVSRVLRKRGL
ncbi:hypothetical protein TheveDRAFT_0307 [Thermanaerovibrio velox DSM 12556]|uniref:Uncharacterized protein n=1 Tax=Thermanaerovibrio velox DSM 12556 TaxID=926567 RepID=H0UP64_9BACT|nr:hypothetical protein [Thermanaerovibrio velox]EHM09477.1 hypothetical protein TheveDRAFT_0307 [Thermanaerovibrio velox DSM 12556]